MKQEQIEVLERFAVVMSLLYIIYGVRLVIAYRHWLKRKNSWKEFWSYRGNCETGVFDYLVEVISLILFGVLLVLWVMSPTIK